MRLQRLGFAVLGGEEEGVQEAGRNRSPSGTTWYSGTASSRFRHAFPRRSRDAEKTRDHFTGGERFFLRFGVQGESKGISLNRHLSGKRGRGYGFRRKGTSQDGFYLQADRMLHITLFIKSHYRAQWVYLAIFYI
jgi:hypothetical protein